VVAPTTEEPVGVQVLAGRWMGCLVPKGGEILLVTYLSLGALDHLSEEAEMETLPRRKLECRR